MSDQQQKHDLISIVAAHLVTPVPAPVQLPTGPKSPEVESAEQERWQRDRIPYRDAHASRTTTNLDHLRVILEESAPAFQNEEKEQAKRVQDLIKELGTLETARDVKAMALNDARERLRQEYERLCKLPNIAAVKINATKLIVETHDLIMTLHDRTVTRWNVGPWEIHIPPNNDLCELRCHSLRGRVRVDRAGWVHPHVNIHGDVCWGNLQDTLRIAANTAQYDVLVELVLAILTDGRKYTTAGDGTGHEYGKRLTDIGDQVR